MYGKRGVFPYGFGLIGSGKGTLGLRGLGGGGLNGLTGLVGLGGIRIGLNVVGRTFGVSDRLGTDLIGRYGLLSLGGIDDFTAGLLGDGLFDPGAIVGLTGGARVASSGLGLLSGMHY